MIHYKGTLQGARQPQQSVDLFLNIVRSGEVIPEFTDGDTTPSVLTTDGNKLFKTSNTGATTISDFDDGYIGQEIHVIINDAVTTVDFTSSGLKGNAGADWSPTTGDHMSCIYDGTDWYCNVSDNTA